MMIDIRKGYRTANIIGLEVRNPRGEHLGKIEEIVVDVESGRIEYLVLAVGSPWAGLLGRGQKEKRFAVPLKELALRYDESTRYFVLDVDRKRLESAAGFDNAHWPDTAENWREQFEPRPAFPAPLQEELPLATPAGNVRETPASQAPALDSSTSHSA